MEESQGLAYEIRFSRVSDECSLRQGDPCWRERALWPLEPQVVFAQLSPFQHDLNVLGHREDLAGIRFFIVRWITTRCTHWFGESLGTSVFLRKSDVVVVWELQNCGKKHRKTLIAYRGIRLSQSLKTSFETWVRLRIFDHRGMVPAMLD